jgi:Zn ribbon nucleic-acid-binding protein
MHKWTRKWTEDNRPYKACVHCGTEDVRGEGMRPGAPEIGGG